MNTAELSKRELTYEEFFRLHVSETCPITEKPENATSYDPVYCTWITNPLEEDRRRILAGLLRPKD